MKNAPQNIAVVGSGIAGIASAWFLSQTHKVTLFEQNDYLGGHTHTVKTKDFSGKDVAVDTGFIVYNEPNYPYLTAMLRHLNIETLATEMSFSVSIDQGELEYSGNNFNTLFAQRKNLFSLSHWRMLFQILRFNRLAKRSLNFGDSGFETLTLGEFLNRHGFSQKMIDHYLLPMAAAIWSCPTQTMKAFPVRSFLQFFENHGLLNVNERPQWQTVKEGSERYIEAILKQSSFGYRLNAPVKQIHPRTDSQGVEIVFESGERACFDQVVIAAHGDQAWRMISSNVREQFYPLSAFHYQKNIAYLHSDERLMPSNKATWAAWNYLRDTRFSSHDRVAVTYWMNLLQSLETSTPFFVTLNPMTPPATEKTHGVFHYDHPVFDQKAMAAQKQLQRIQGRHGLWFAGAYSGYGFHEDGLRSAVNIAKLFAVPLPWEKE